MDVLHAISSPNPDICKKVLDISLSLVTPRNVEEVVTVLKRELLKSRDSDMEKGAAFRDMLVQALHDCSSRFPEVAEGVVSTLMDFVGGDGALKVVVFVRAIVEQYPELREGVLQTLLASIGDMAKTEVMAVTMWILGEYCVNMESVSAAFEAIVGELGAPPFIVAEEAKEEKKDEEATITTKVRGGQGLGWRRVKRRGAKGEASVASLDVTSLLDHRSAPRSL